MELFEIEELIKTLDPKAIKDMMRYAAILDDPKATKQAKIEALNNVKTLTSSSKMPKPITQQPETPITPESSISTAASSQIEYPQGLHLSPLNAAGHDEEKMKGIFHSLPDHEKKAIADWHASTNITKSIDSLCYLFQELKKRI